LKRLHDTIVVESPTLSFSGRKYFYITKSMMLTFAGALVTFELVLLERIDKDDSDFCSIIEY
jgi:hypothetical protein